MKTCNLEVYHIESLGALDGPGVRMVIFLQGCPLKCAYCHNPDSWKKGEGHLYDLESLVSEVMKYKAYFGAKGGVTLSGGEPLLQARALIPFINQLKEEGIHVALDTSGAIWSSEIRQVLNLVDLVLLDIKAPTEALYQELTNSSIKNPLKVLKYIQSIEKTYWIRHVVLPGYEMSDSINTLTSHPMRMKIDLLKYHSMGLEKWQPWQLKYRRIF